MAGCNGSDDKNVPSPTPSQTEQNVEPTDTKTPEPTEPNTKTPEPTEIVEQPKDKTMAAPSMDGKYRAEAYGVIQEGKNTYDGLRIIRQEDDTTIWEKKSEYLSVDFRWSPGSKYLGINYTARTYADNTILDMDKLEEINLPDLSAISPLFGENEKPREYRPDPEFVIDGWLDSDTVYMDFSWTTVEDQKFENKYSYNLKTKTVEIFEMPTSKVYSAVSPDGRYRAEAYADLVNGVFESYDGIRVIRLEDDELVWSMTPEYLTVEFLWSSESNYLAINYSARTYAESTIVDIGKKEEVHLPGMVGIFPLVDKDNKPRSYRPDPVFRFKRWEEHETAVVEFSWTTVNDDEFSGVYAFNLKTGEITLV